MLINMRNGLMAGGGKLSAKSYVQDGLVAMWDGIENAGWGQHDPNATTWKNLITEVATQNVGIAPVWLDTCVSFSNSNYFVENISALQQAFSSNTVTFEFVGYYGAGSKEPQSLMSIGGSGRPLWCFYRNNTTIATTFNQGSGETSISIPSTKSIFSFSQVCKNAYCNSKYVGAVTQASGNYTATNVWLGTMPYNLSLCRCSGALYNARIYAKNLTADEIAANYAVDKARFGLPDAT